MTRRPCGCASTERRQCCPGSGPARDVDRGTAHRGHCVVLAGPSARGCSREARVEPRPRHDVEIDRAASGRRRPPGLPLDASCGHRGRHPRSRHGARPRRSRVGSHTPLELSQRRQRAAARASARDSAARLAVR
jgi:hypothetical protein